MVSNHVTAVRFVDTLLDDGECKQVTRFDSLRKFDIQVVHVVSIGLDAFEFKFCRRLLSL